MACGDQVDVSKAVDGTATAKADLTVAEAEMYERFDVGMSMGHEHGALRRGDDG